MTAGDRSGRIPARLEYAVRALLALAVAQPGTVSAQSLARARHIPLGYLYDVLAELRRAGLIYARRGADGGYRLARPASQISLGDLVRVFDATGIGPAAPGPAGVDEAGIGDDLLAERLGAIWSAAQRATRRVFDEVSLPDLATVEIAVPRADGQPAPEPPSTELRGAESGPAD